MLIPQMCAMLCDDPICAGDAGWSFFVAAATADGDGGGAGAIVIVAVFGIY